jgi:hypothetical protein
VILNRRSVLLGLVAAPVVVRAGLVMPISAVQSKLTTSALVQQQFIVVYQAWGGLGGRSEDVTTLWANNLEEAIKRATHGVDQFEVGVAGPWPADIPALNWTPARMSSPQDIDALTGKWHNPQN